MADSALRLPGEFEAGKRYQLKGETMQGWKDALVRDRVVPGPNQLEQQTPGGRMIIPKPGELPAYLVTPSIPEGVFYIEPGTTALAPPDDPILDPVMTKLDEVPLDAKPRPALPIPGDGYWEIWIGFGEEESNIVLIGGDDELPDEECVFILIYTFSVAGGELSEEKQIRTGHVAVINELCSSSSSSSSESSSSSSSSSSSESSSSESSSESSGSSKDTAIVPASWSETGYAALYVVEMPEVRFEDVLRAELKGRVTRVNIDPRFVEVCQPGTLEVVGLVPDRACMIGATVDPEEMQIVIDQAILDGFPTANEVRLRLSALRRGFAGVRWGNRTRVQFLANEKSINAHYPAEGVTPAMNLERPVPGRRNRIKK